MRRLLFALLFVFIISRLHAKKDRKAIKSFKKGYESFLNRLGDKKDTSKKAKEARLKVFKKNLDAMKRINVKGKAFKFNEQGKFLFLSDEEKKQYLGLQNTTVLEKEAETEVPGRGKHPLLNRVKGKVELFATKQRPGREKGKYNKLKNKLKNNAEKKIKEKIKKGKNKTKGLGMVKRDLQKRQEENAIPASMDLRILNLVSAPRDQLTCSSCWAFGGVAVLEGAFALATGFLKDFSEQQVIDCNLYYGCSGGFWVKGWKQIKEDRYAALRADQPYIAEKRAQCDKTTPNGLTDIMTVGSYSINRVENDEENMLDLLNSYGPLAVAVKADDTLFFYGSGVIDACLGGKSGIDHLVTLVGYDETSLLMKNSWGTDWGEDGFFRVVRGCGPSLLGYSYWASYLSIVSLVEGVSTPFEESAIIYGSDDYFIVKQTSKVQKINQDITDIGGLKFGDVITIEVLNETLTNKNFKLELNYKDNLGNIDKVYKLQFYDTDNPKVRQMTKTAEGSILRSVYTKVSLEPGAVIEIIIAATGYSVSFDGVDLPIHPHVLPLDTINIWFLEAKTSTGLFANVTLTRKEEKLRDLTGSSLAECVDLDSYCVNYLEEDANTCTDEATAEWMESYCPKSCNKC
ncbi:hypothetical protein ACHWQZ_G009100 [Mnemiopsis leidyi]